MMEQEIKQVDKAKGDMCVSNGCGQKPFAETPYGPYCSRHWAEVKGYYKKGEYNELFRHCVKCGKWVRKPMTECFDCRK